MKLITMYFSPLPYFILSFIPKYLTQRPILEHPQPMFVFHCERPCFTPIKTPKITVLYMLMFLLLDSKLIGKGFCTDY